MEIKCLLGRSGTGKTHYLMEEIRRQLAQGTSAKLILLVPEQFTLQAERDLIEKLNLEGILEIEVLSFTRLAYQVFNEVGGLTAILINDIGKNMAIRKLLQEYAGELTIYQKSIRQEGFVQKINELVTEMKQHDITPEQLLGLADQEQEPLLRLKLKDFSLLYQQLNQFMAQTYLDSEDHMNFFIEKLKESRELEGAFIWMDGFHQITPQLLRVLDELTKKAACFTVALTLDPQPQGKEGDLFDTTQKTLKQIQGLAQARGTQVRYIPLIHGDFSESRPLSLRHLEQEMNAYPYQVFEGIPAGLELYAGANPYWEIEHVAGKIVELVREAQCRYQDIAIVAGDLERYGVMVKRVFSEYQIPYFMDEKRSIMDHPLVELILAGLDSLRRGFRYEDMFRYLKTGFAALDKNETEILENYVLAFGIRGRRWEAEFTLGDTEKLGYLNELRERAIRPLAVFQKGVKDNPTVKAMTQTLFAFLQELKIEAKLEAWIERLKVLGRYEEVNENTQIWNQIMALFDQLVEIFGQQEMGLSDFAKILEAGFQACEIGVIPSTVDQVLVGNLERSRSHDVKVLFVVGVNDGIIPAVSDDSGLFSQLERQRLSEAGIQLGSWGESRLAEEKLNLYLALSRPSQRLVLTYAMADQEGRALRPSLLISRMKKLYPTLQPESDLLLQGKDLEWVSTPGSTFKYLVENLRLLLDEKEIHPLWWHVLDWYGTHPDWQNRTRWMLRGLFHENQPRPLPAAKVKALYQTPIHASISRLERFSNCPFSHLVAYGLKPEERKEYQLRYPDIGRLFHQALELFGRQLQSQELNWRSLEQEQCHSLADSIVDTMLESFENGILHSSHRYRYMTRQLKRVSRRALWTLTEQLKQGTFEPLGHEIDFSDRPGARLPALVVELGQGEQVYLQGVIDRVDILTDGENQYVKIIDYKSGAKDFDMTEVYYGLQLQLLVYLDAVLSMKGISGGKLYPGGVFYFRIDDPLIRTTERATEHIEKEINRALKLKGLVLKDLKVIKAMDGDLEGTSHIIPVRLNKGDEIGKGSAVLSLDGFSAFIRHIRQLIREISWEILKGNVKILPCKKGKQVSCQYCDYAAVCQFDASLEDNRYRFIRELKEEEILERLLKEGGEFSDA